ncbi:MAG: hypothetical protein AB7V18_12365, partial [Pyrinomonadaceae bacterium]
SQTARPTSARIETEAARRFAPNSPKGTFDVLAKPDIFICYQQKSYYRDRMEGTLSRGAKKDGIEMPPFKVPLGTKRSVASNEVDIS